MTHFAISAVGVDRPGIVAAVTGALVDRGCNLEDSSMSVLRGHFAMTLVVAGPDDLEAAALEAALAGPAGQLGLVLVVGAIDDPVASAGGGRPWTVTVYGADHPGIVHGVASVLADQGVNITDLTTRVIGGADDPVYAMVLDVTVPAEVDAPALWARLEERSSQLGVECTARPAEADIL